MADEIHEDEFFFGRIGEMGTADAVAIDLPVPTSILERIKADDENPMFVTAEVESGWSESKRKWKPDHLRKVVEKVNNNQMGGVLGHPLLDPKEHAGGFPKPQVLWVAARLKDHGDKAVAKFKGYVLKSAEAREYLKLGLIDGVSIFGDTRMKPIQGGYEVIDFHPESIDFARKGRSGMKSRVVALTGEQMTGGNKVEPKDIAALSEDELRTHAPLLVREIERKAVEPVEQKVGEQATAVAELQPQVDTLTKIKELLKTADGENPVEKVESLLKTVEDAAASEVRSFIDSLITKKVKTPRAQALVKRLIGEMHTEYVGQEFDDALKKKIEEDFTSKIEGDEDVKALVGEMISFSDEGTRDGSRGGTRMGGRSQAGSERNDTNRRGSLVISKTKVS